jgi:hypothetical protein
MTDLPRTTVHHPKLTVYGLRLYRDLELTRLGGGFAGTWNDWKALHGKEPVYETEPPASGFLAAYPETKG